MSGSADARASGGGAAPPAGSPTWWAARGFDLCAGLAPSRYDALVPPAWRCACVLPGAASVQLLGSGGDALWRALRNAPEWRAWLRDAAGDPLDRYTERIGAEACARLRDAGRSAQAVFAHEDREGAFADFVALAHAAGLGAPGRLGLLLHPQRGPWVSLRLLLFSDAPQPDRARPAAPQADFAPCVGCAAPCADACHGGALLPEGFSVDRCAEARGRVPACAVRCDARHACVLGPGHAYEAAAEAHHMAYGGIQPASGATPAARRPVDKGIA